MTAAMMLMIVGGNWQWARRCGVSPQANIELVRQWVEQVWNAGNLDLLTHFHPASFDNHGRSTTIEESKQWHLHNRATFPDIHYTIDDAFATDDQVAVRWTATATHRGTLWNMIPPTGKTIIWNGMHLLRLANKQIVEVWAVQNTIAQLQQMGVTLQPAADVAERTNRVE
jgi:predicted ester cyclase